MAKRNNTILLLLLLSAILLVGCKSTKTAQTADAAPAIPLSEIKAMQAIQGAPAGYSTKMKLTFETIGKNISSQGTLRLKEGEGIQMSVTPLGLFEVARVEFSPLYVLMMNRLKKEYSMVHYSNVSLLQQLGLNYTLLESVLQNKVNLPATKPADESLRAMNITFTGDTLRLSHKADGITYDYYIVKSSGLLVKSVGTHGNGTAVTCLYEGFRPVGEKLFPHSITLMLSGSAAPVKLSLLLNNVNETLEYSATAPSSSYKKVSATSLLEALGGK
ncbi:MAG: DUF4292 domain-containing protein [Bacteroidaceae bacterium]|nr:DUF4292 domain-containing protein [Bacteroidaceae bacterium]